MRKNYFVSITVLISLVDCTLQPLGNGGYRLSTPSFVEMLNQTAGSSGGEQVSSTSGTRSSLNYAGQIDGGTAKATLTALGAGQYHLDLGATGTGPSGQLSGMGGVSGTLIRSADGDVYGMTKADDGNPCALTVRISDKAMQIDEDFKAGRTGCMAEHGAALSFDGTLYQTGS